MRLKLLWILTIFNAILFVQCTENRTLLFIGSYTEGAPAQGVKVYDLDLQSGKTKLLSVVDSIINPSFLRLSDNGQFLFVVSESQLKTDGFISSYTVNNKSGELNFISKQSTLGRNPVHIEIAPDQNSMVVSNYTDPSLTLYNIDLKGNISEPIQHLAFQDSSIVEGRQDEAHIHSASFSKDGKYLYAHDLGADKVRAFLVGDSLKDNEVPDLRINPGAGPRHFTFDKEGEYGYLLSELSGSIIALKYDDQSGQLEQTNQYQTYGQKQEIYRSADIHLSPVLGMIYVSNRGPEENTIVVFKEIGNGQLEFAQRVSTEGEHPRNFAIDPSGNLIIIANQHTDNVVVKKLNRQTGLIEELIDQIPFENPSAIQICQY